MTKNSDLKSRISHRKKYLAAALAAGLLATSFGAAFCAPAYAAETKKPAKEETVYVKADAEGNVNEIIVSDWLKNDGKKAEIKDRSDLTDIENVKGDETFTQNGEDLTWQAGGADIYYQGKSTKSVPVSVKVSYKLDGKPISAKDIAGKSGKVVIRFDYTNNEMRTVPVGGKNEEICVPFTVLTGILLPADTFTNVEVENGRLVSEGSNDIVIGYALPGLADSLKLSDSLLKEHKDEIKIPDYVEITADVTDFEMGMSMTFASSGILSEADIAGKLNTGDLKEAMDELDKSSALLVEGSKAVSEGANTLKSSFAQYQSGEEQLADGISELQSGAGALSEGAASLDAGAGQLSSGLNSLNSGLNVADQGGAALMAGLDGTSKQPGLVDGAAAVAGGADKLNTGAKSLHEGTKTVSGGAASLDEGIGELKSGIEGMYDNISGQAEAYAEAAASQPAAQQTYADAMTDLSAKIQAADSASQAMASASAQAGAAQAAYEAAVNSGDEEAAAAAGSAAQTAQGALSQAQTDYATAMEELAAAASTANEAATALAQASGAAGAYQAFDGIKTGMESQNLFGEEGALNQLKSGSEALASGTASLEKGAGDLESGAGDLASGASDLSSGVGQLRDGASDLTSGISTANAGSSQLAGGAKSLSDGTKELSGGAKTLKAGVDQLSIGSVQLNAATGLIMDGISQLASGTDTLADGMAKFDEEGIKKITDTFGGDVQDLTDRIEALQLAEKSYTSYSGLADGTEGSVRFLIETEEISMEE